jgi:hypothetical protein
MVALLRMPNRISPDAGRERRVFPRKEVHCRVQGKRIDHSVIARREPFLSLATQDVSVGGVGAFSDRPLDVGERVTLFFPPQGVQRGWDAYGRVLRCDASAMGWRVAIEFDPLPAA